MCDGYMLQVTVNEDPLLKYMHRIKSTDMSHLRITGDISWEVSYHDLSRSVLQNYISDTVKATGHGLVNLSWHSLC